MRDALSAYVALGANLGDAAQAVRDALAHLDALKATRVVRLLRCTAAPLSMPAGPITSTPWPNWRPASPRPSCWRNCSSWNWRRDASAPTAMRRARSILTCCCMASARIDSPH